MSGADAERRCVRVANKRLARIETERINLAQDHAKAPNGAAQVAVLADAVRAAASAPDAPTAGEGPDYTAALTELRALVRNLHKHRRAAANQVLKAERKRQKRRREVAE